MENLPLQFTNAHINQRQKAIRQDMDRARLGSKALSDQVTRIITSVDSLFEAAMTPLIRRDTQTRKKKYTN